jgi:hypothetical protein
MQTEYYTTVTASDGFWEGLITDKLISGFPTVFHCEEAGFTITSMYGPAIWDMIELSNEYPDEHFDVVVTTNNKYQDVIEYYEFQRGATFFNHLEPLYHFDISDAVGCNVCSEVIDEFKNEIIEALDRLLDFDPSYEHVIGINNPKQEMVSNIQFEYGHQDITLNAKVICKTYIQIDIKSDSLERGPDY